MVLIIVGTIVGVYVGTSRNAYSTDAAGRMMAKQLALAHSYALGNRCYIAVLLPNHTVGVADTPTVQAVDYKDYFDRASRIVRVNRTAADPNTFRFAGYIPGAEWIMLPQDTMYELTANSAAKTCVHNDDLTETNLVFRGGSVAYTNFPAIVFDPNGIPVGRPDQATLTIRRFGGHNTTSGPTHLKALAFTRADESPLPRLTVNWLTGCVEFSRVLR